MSKANYRTAVTPVSNRAKLLRQFSDEELAFVREARLIHNGIGTWANALLNNGFTIPEVKTTLSAINEEIQKL